MNKKRKGAGWFTVLLIAALICANIYLLNNTDWQPEKNPDEPEIVPAVTDSILPPVSVTDLTGVSVTDAEVTGTDAPDIADVAVSGGDALPVTGTDLDVTGGADTTGSIQTDIMTLPEVDEETAKLRDSLLQMNLGSGIQADGMSVNRSALPGVELGIAQCDVYCRDSYQFVPLCGQELTWSTSDPEIATVDMYGKVSTLKAGKVTITATDSSGSSDSCVVNVVKVAYITIDDTPTEHTPRLLDILDQYGVKATFFMNADPDEKEQYVEIYKRGHTFALHGYKHYTSYADGEYFLQNMEKARQFIMEATGCDSIDNLVRFPTGSKGHRNYKSILEYIQYRDYKAYDWTTEFHDYYYHSVDGCLEYFKTYLTHDRDIVLFHPREWSVDALPQALDYIIEQGYTMAPMTQDTAQYNFHKLYIGE